MAACTNGAREVSFETNSMEGTCMKVELAPDRQEIILFGMPGERPPLFE